MSRDFAHLHIHTEYSLLDGACRLERLCAQAKALGIKALAITDHGNLFGALKFYNQCRKAGIKPLFGCEFYMALGSRFERNGDEKKSLRHLVLLAKDYQGYQNLMELSSRGYLEGFYYKPRIDLELLQQHAGGLICLSGCLKNPVAVALLEGKPAVAGQWVDRLQSIFGREHFFLELMDQGIREQRMVNEQYLRLAQRQDTRLVATNDCHYITREDAEIHDILLCIQTNSSVSDKKRLRFATDQFYLKSPLEMAELFKEAPEAITNTTLIAEMCNVELPVGELHLPQFTPPQGLSCFDYLCQLVNQGMHKRYPQLTSELQQRVQSELGTIQQMGFENYFLIVNDFCRYAREHGIPVGPGRGSAAGSLVAYALGITDIDPLDQGLLFERFLNAERISLPDIDIDFCYEKRDQVIEYVRSKYGAANVAQIITFGSMKARNAVRDVGRVLGIPLATVDRIAKLIPFGPSLAESLKMVPELRESYESDRHIRKLLDSAMGLEGSVRHPSTHAAGVVIGDRPLTQIVPLYKSASEEMVCTQFDMHDVESMGLLKMDFLGLRNLTIIQKTIEQVHKTHGVKIDWNRIGLEDPKTYQILQEGKTTGVFQLESSGMTELIKKLRPERFEDLVAVLALFRPGPLGSGMVKDFIERKHRRQKIRYDHSLLQPILEETYGIILYQEQVMLIANQIGGFSLGEADVLRRAMGKKKPEEMKPLRQQFIDGARERGVETKVAGKIFDRMEYFAGYGFNKSHSAAYAVITFRTAYLKAHYPVEYMAALLTGELGNQEKSAYYIKVCRDMGIRVLPPDVQESEASFTAVGNNIRFGLAAVKNVGESAVRAIIQARQQGGKFSSFQDFCLRVDLSSLTSRMIESLIKCGAFDSLGLFRSQLLKILPDVLETAIQQQRERTSAQSSFFTLIRKQNHQLPDEIKAPELPDWTPRDKLQHEKELVGFFITGHPLDKFQTDFYSFALPSQKLKKARENQRVVYIGVVDKITNKLDRNGNTIAFVQMEDYQGRIEAIFFHEAFEKFRHLLQQDEVLVIRGSVNRRNEDTKLQVFDACAPEEFRRKKAKALLIDIPLSACGEENLRELRQLLSRYKGSFPLYMMVDGGEDKKVELKMSKECSVVLDNDFLEELQKLNFEKRLTFRSSLS